MKEAVSAALLTDLSCELSNEELGAAIRIISRICESQKPVARRTIHIAAGMDKKHWEEMEETVLKFFVVDDQGVDLDADTGATSAANCEKVFTSRSRQGELPLAMVRPTLRRPSVPQYAKEEKPPAVSIRKAIYDQALFLFKEAGMAERSARAVLASLLKNYPEGDVAMAVSDACKKDAIADPHTWILGRLKGAAKNRTNRRGAVPAPQSRNQIVTPELGGISNNRASKIRERNQKLKLKMPT